MYLIYTYCIFILCPLNLYIRKIQSKKSESDMKRMKIFCIQARVAQGEIKSKLATTTSSCCCYHYYYYNYYPYTNSPKDLCKLPIPGNVFFLYPKRPIPTNRVSTLSK